VRSALIKVTGVAEVISVDRTTKKAVVKVEKGKVTNDVLIKVIDDADTRFTASVVN
jgi:copper chaperone CopZ